MSEGRTFPARSGGDKRGASARGSQGPQARDDSAEALLEIADELEAQARDLLRQARQLQKVAEKLSRSGRPAAPSRGGRGSERKSRGPGPRRVAGEETRSRSEPRAGALPEDEWQSTSDRRPRRTDPSDRERTRSRTGARREPGEGGKPDRSPTRPAWAPKGKRPRGG